MGNKLGVLMLRPYVKFLIVLAIPLMVMGLGPCDNGALPGDPLDESASTTEKAATPAPVVTPTPKPSPTPAPAVVKIDSIKIVDKNSVEITEIKDLKIGDTVKLSVNIKDSTGKASTVDNQYDGSALVWKSTTPVIVMLLNSKGNYLAKASGTTFLSVQHPKFKLSIKVTVK